MNSEPKVNGHVTDEVDTNCIIGSETPFSQETSKNPKKLLDKEINPNEVENDATDHLAGENPVKKKRRKRKVKDYPWGHIKKKKKRVYDVSFFSNCVLYHCDKFMGAILHCIK